LFYTVLFFPSSKHCSWYLDLQDVKATIIGTDNY
jgi:hypothetical protein